MNQDKQPTVRDTFEIGSAYSRLSVGNANHASNESFHTLDFGNFSLLELRGPNSRLSFLPKKHNYSASPDELMIVPSNRFIRSMEEMTANELQEVFNVLFTYVDAVRISSSGSAFISWNYHDTKGVRDLPWDKTGRVQTLEQIHFHVGSFDKEYDTDIPWNSLSKAQQLEVRDPFIFVANDLLSNEIQKNKSLFNDVFRYSLDTSKYPLGTNLYLDVHDKGPSKVEAVTKIARNLHELITKLYTKVVEDLTYCAITGLSIKDTSELISDRYSGLSKYSKRLLVKSSRRILDNPSDSIYDFVSGCAYSIGIFFEANELCSINIQPRILSRGNIVSTTGVIRQGFLNLTEDLKVTRERYQARIFGDLTRGLDSFYCVEKQATFDRPTPCIPDSLIQKSIQLNKETLKIFGPLLVQADRIRTLLDVPHTISSTTAPEAVFDTRGNCGYERVFAKNHPDYHDEDIEANVRAFAALNFKANGSNSKVSEPYLLDESSERVTLQGRCIYDRSVSSNLVQEKIEELKLRVCDNNIRITASYGRAKDTLSVVNILTSGKQESVSEIVDLHGVRLVFNDLSDLQTAFILLKDSESVVAIRNIYIEPLKSHPYFRGVFVYSKDVNGNLFEIQLITEGQALLSIIGHSLEFKPQADLYRGELEEILQLGDRSVNDEDLCRITRDTFHRAYKHLILNDWQNFVKMPN